MELDKAVERILASEGLGKWMAYNIIHECPNYIDRDVLDKSECSTEKCIECWLKAFGCEECL